MIRAHRGSNLLEHPALIRKGIFSSHEAARILGWSLKEIHPILFRLVKKGKLARIKRGLFCIQPPGNSGLTRSGYSQNWLLIAKALAGNNPYFISYYSAMQLHAMTGQSIQTVFMSLPVQFRLPNQLQIPIHFVTISPKRFWGLEEKWVTQEAKVWVTDKERTVLDILDRPDLAGGFSEICRALWMIRNDIDSSKLIAYAKRFASYAAAKRLGFIMEEMSIGQGNDIEKLSHFIKSSSSYALLDPTAKKTGCYLKDWHLLVNQDITLIKRNLIT